MSTCASFLATTVEVVESLGFLTAMGEAVPLSPVDQAVTVVVDFSGHRRGQVIVATSGAALGAELARNMLGMGPSDQPGPDDAVEAVKELANVLAGNLLPTLLGIDGEYCLEAPCPVPAMELTGDHVCGIELMEGQVAVVVRAVAG